MSTSDKVFGTLMFLAFYIWVGGMVGWILDDVMGLVPLTEDASPAKYVGLILLWPLFAIKFLALGLWSVLYSGFALLF